MNQHNRFEDCIKTLATYQYRRGIHYKLDHVNAALNALGSPTQKLAPCIHVAGTNGKGSTVTMIAAGLQSLGVKVGTFTSPHITCYTERFMINDRPISKQDFVTHFETVHKIATQYTLTEFEILFLMACLYFNASSLDFCCFEVGLGGRLDATNTISPCLSIITQIGMDHTDILGPKLSDIVNEKGGIIKQNVPVIVSETQTDTVRTTLHQICTKQGAPYIESKPVSHPLSPPYQNNNQGLAVSAFQALHETGYIHALPDHSPNTPWINKKPWGRFSIIKTTDQTLLFDGAHNTSAISGLISSIETQFPKTPPTIVLGVLKRKDSAGILLALSRIETNGLYYCDFDPPISETYDVMVDLNPQIKPWEVGAAIPKGGMVVFCGSLYFLSLLTQTLPECRLIKEAANHLNI